MSLWADHIVDRLQKEFDQIPRQHDENIQHLAELGYLPVWTLNALRPQQVKLAEEAFMTDARLSSLIDFGHLAKMGISAPQQQMNYLLRTLTQIDEGLLLASLPGNNEKSLRSRIIHYRLELAGLWQHPIDLPFTQINTRLALDELAGLLQTSALDAINQMADVDNLVLRLKTKLPAENFILCFRSDQVDEESTKEVNRPFAFKQQLIDDFGERSEFFRFLNQHILVHNIHKVDINFLRSLSKKPLNRFLVRMVQLHQWKNGFYTGLLDGNAGPLTLQSLLPAFDMMAEQNHSNSKPHRLITTLPGGYFLMNSYYFFEQIISPDESGNNPEAAIHQLIVAYEKAGDDDKNSFDQNFARLKDETRNKGFAPQERQGCIERLYYGVSRFTRKIFGFAKRLFRLICRQAKRFSNFIKKWLSVVSDDLREGLRAFLSGMAFLFGKNAILQQRNDAMLVSVLSIFGDSYTLAAGNYRAGIEKQCADVRYATAALDFALAITGSILKLVVEAVSMVGWPMLLLSIVHIYKKIVSSYQRLDANPEKPLLSLLMI